MSASFSKSGPPVLDEATFQKLLAAAYVLQEHHDRTVQAATPDPKRENPDTDSDTSILAQIVETQHEIQANHLDLEGTTNLVVERIVKITGAQGAAVGLVNEDKVAYRAGRGILAAQVGQEFRPEATLSASTFLHDVILRCPDAATDFRVNPEITKRLGIGSMIAVPVLHSGKTGGALELVFTKKDAFHDQDVRTCQLMAGLVTETLTRTAEEEWRKGLAAERASMLEVLEKIKPQLARLAASPDAVLGLSKVPQEPPEPKPVDTQCQNCGNEVAEDEVFCASCGTSRSSISRNDLQSKWATLWNLRQAAESASHATSAPEEKDPLFHQLGDANTQDSTERDPSHPAGSLLEHDQDGNLVAPKLPSEDAVPAVAATSTEEVTSSARNAPEGRVWFRSIAVSPPAMQLRGFLQKHAPFIREHRGDLALVGAFVLFLITILWAASSNKSTTAADSGSPATSAAAAPAKAKRKAPAQPKLSFFDQMLVNMGLAEPPPAPSYSGNPNIPVWIDVHTALYYCPGADLYGKTPQGRIASQHDAQLDQFEPASRKVCD
jgi:GAF domain-containing protein